MAYDRYDNRDERSRWRDERFEGRTRGRDDERGFLERAGDEVASWFGDEEAERRRREDMRDEGRDRGWNRDNRPRFYGRSERERDEHRPERGWPRDETSRPSFGRSWGSTGRDLDRDPSYRPLTGDYGRSTGYFTPGSFERGGPREAYTGFAAGPYASADESRGSAAESSRDFDPHYRSMRQRHIDDLDRDYEEYRRENQARFEDDFSGWRQRRLGKRQMLTVIREHMEVIGSDDEHVGTVDRIAGDRIILTKSDPESGGVHHSLSCADVGRVEGDKVILDCTGEQAKQRWRDESRGRALFEREDQGDMGDRILDRSFEGTYR